MNANNQQCVRTSMEPLYRWVIVDNLDINRKRLKGAWYADILIYRVKLILGNTVANVYT